MFAVRFWIYPEGFARKLNNHVFPGSGYMRKTADYADAGVSRLRSSSHNLSRYVLPTRACRSRPSLSLLSVATCCRSRFGAAKIIFKIKKQRSVAAATAGFAEGKTATRCASVSEHQRNQRFFPKGSEVYS